MRSKKGIELTLNTIVVAALVLIVLVVMVIIFTGGFGDLTKKLFFIKNQATSKADCIVIGGDTAHDKDGDGYHDSLSYDYQCKLADGTTKNVKCKCDSDPTNKNVHEDDKCCT